MILLFIIPLAIVLAVLIAAYRSMRTSDPEQPFQPNSIPQSFYE